MKNEQIKSLIRQQENIKEDVEVGYLGVGIGGFLIFFSLIFGRSFGGFFIISLEFIIGIIVIIVSSIRINSLKSKITDIDIKLSEVPEATLEKLRREVKKEMKETKELF